MPLITRNCDYCEVSFQVRKAEIDRGNGKFCSCRCANASHTPAQRIPNASCAHCGTLVYVKPSAIGKNSTGLRFCSRACMDTHPWRAPSYNKNCFGCGRPLARSKKKYCNFACKVESQQKKWIEEWLAGSHRDGDEYTSHRIRTYLFKIHNSRCQQCGWSRVNLKSGRIPLTVNHIDGNHRNNDPANVELICPCCHSLTPNYGALNRGNGRPKRRKSVGASEEGRTPIPRVAL